ncbi:endonuclease/exonuclease/phosphatase family protein [Mangrovivirga sp. M17]|uniref:Endonuclease/exonuclease/phosphatase family protein n=1 Tax=Mangrovivirga halotolerans TaxID=2993936 RepID=A0ABT3RQ24_9BACT|nr:endonuclease/exonuclease/phosphatase family protein [Mangrovivirga halotolerans]
MIISILCFTNLYSQVRVATFNCEFLVEKTIHVKYGLPFRLSDTTQEVREQWTDQFRSKKFNEATIEVAKYIHTLNADVIGLQEVGQEEEVDLLIEKLDSMGTNYSHSLVCFSRDNITGQRVAILSKFPILEGWDELDGRSYFFTEPDMDETDDTGVSKGLKATIKINNDTVDFYVLHLKSERGGAESDYQRLGQASIVRRYIINSLEVGNHVVVMGDLNSQKRHPVILRIRGFDDIYEELIQSGDDIYIDDKTTRNTYTYLGTQEQIDHILISYSLRKFKTKIIPTTDKFISDHNAVIVDIDL